jgi:hypothetical protein
MQWFRQYRGEILASLLMAVVIWWFLLRGDKTAQSMEKNTCNTTAHCDHASVQAYGILGKILLTTW